MPTSTHCFECDKLLDNLNYALYQANNNKSKITEQEEQIIGYLCEQCRQKHKMKPLTRKQDHMKALEKLRQQLIE